MKKKILFVVLLAAVFTTHAAVKTDNLLENGDFSKKTRKWQGKIDDQMIGENGVGVVELHPSQARDFSQYFSLPKNCAETRVSFKYKISADYKGRGFRVVMERGDGSYTYLEHQVKAGSLDWQDFSWDFSDFNDAKNWTFRIEVRPGAGSICFDDFAIIPE